MTSEQQNNHDKIDRLLIEAKNQLSGDVNEARKKLKQALSIIRTEHNKLKIR